MAAITPRRCQPVRDLRQDQHQCSGCHRDLNTQVPHGGQWQDLRAALGTGDMRSQAAMAAQGRSCVTATEVWLPRGGCFTHLQPVTGTPHTQIPPLRHCAQAQMQISLPVGPKGDARAEAAALPVGTGTWLCSPRLSAKPPSPRLHTPFFKAG